MSDEMEFREFQERRRVVKQAHGVADALNEKVVPYDDGDKPFKPVKFSANCLHDPPRISLSVGGGEQFRSLNPTAVADQASASLRLLAEHLSRVADGLSGVELDSEPTIKAGDRVVLAEPSGEIHSGCVVQRRSDGKLMMVYLVTSSDEFETDYDCYWFDETGAYSGHYFEYELDLIHRDYFTVEKSCPRIDKITGRHPS